jgi:hypothetical protein
MAIPPKRVKAKSEKAFPRYRIEWHVDHGRPNDLFRESWGYW